MRYYKGLLSGLLITSALLAFACCLIVQLAIQPDTGDLSVGPRFIRTLGWTTLQAGLSTLLSVSIGLLLAWALSHQPTFHGRKIYIALLSSALVLPTLVVVLGLVSIFGRSGWLSDILRFITGKPLDPFIYGLSGILLAHCYFNISFAARNLLHRLESIPNNQIKLARSLGLSQWQRFKLIEYPVVATVIPTLATTIFLLCFTSFAIVLTLGGTPKYNTLEVSIYEAIKLDFDLGRALGLALAQLLICGALVAVNASMRTSTALISAEDNNQQLRQDRRTAQWVQATIIILFGGMFALPLLAVVMDGLGADFIRLLTERNFRVAALTSVAIAIASTCIVLLVSTLMAIAITTLSTSQRLGNHIASKIIARIVSFSSTLYLAVPSLVLGIGFFLIARNMGGAYRAWAIAALLTANTLMVLPFALSTLAPAMVKAANRYDKLALSVGVTGWSRWKLIESALLRRELIYIACLAFCMSLGDLGVVALFGSNDFITLPWLLYQKMGSYRTQDAAGIALIMLSLTLTVFLLIPKFLGRKHADT